MYFTLYCYNESTIVYGLFCVMLFLHCSRLRRGYTHENMFIPVIPSTSIRKWVFCKVVVIGCFCICMLIGFCSVHCKLAMQLMCCLLQKVVCFDNSVINRLQIWYTSFLTKPNLIVPCFFNTKQLYLHVPVTHQYERLFNQSYQVKVKS